LEKSTSRVPYVFAFLIPGYSALNNNLLFKQGIMLNWLVFSCVVFGLWRLNERLLSVSNQPLLKWGSLFLGSALYIIAFMALDYYVLHLLIAFSGFSLLSFYLRISLTVLISSFIIESIKWADARELAKLENLKLQTENIETQFNLLIQQANPEFLFHSLSTLQKMVQADDPKAEEYILKLADVYRQTLKKERSPISLREELRFVKSYLFLMMYGEEEAIFVEMSILDESLAYHLPVFSLQLLAENCIKHNAFSVNRPLYIRIFQKDAKSITISNNYQRKAVPSQSFGVGIENLRMRYALEGIEDAVIIEHNETTYTTTIQLF
jgi:two-component system LytT family sensor kinase